MYCDPCNRADSDKSELNSAYAILQPDVACRKRESVSDGPNLCFDWGGLMTNPENREMMSYKTGRTTRHVSDP